jgi:hypothetical protein
MTSPTSLMTGFSFPFRIVVATSGRSPITLLQVSSRSPAGADVSRPNSFKILARVALGEGWEMICRIMDLPVVPTRQLEVCWSASLPFIMLPSRDSMISLINLEGITDGVQLVSDFPS